MLISGFILTFVLSAAFDYIDHRQIFLIYDFVKDFPVSSWFLLIPPASLLSQLHELLFFYLLFVCLFIYLLFSSLLFMAAPQHMEIPRLRVQSELQLPAYTSATATQYLSCICDLHHSSQQYWILKPLREARDWTGILMDTSQLTAEPRREFHFLLFKCWYFPRFCS